MRFLKINLTMILLLFTFQQASAAEMMKPYIAVNGSHTELAETISDVSRKLSSAGFEIVGQYSPYPEATIIVASNQTIQEIAGQSENGVFGSAIRVSITNSADGIQVSYVNPDYMSGIYRMDSLAEISEQMKNALGDGSPFGSEKGIKASKLKKYHYMMAMPYFDDIDVLAEYESHEQALAAVEKNLAAGKAGSVKVYRIDLQGKQASIFGVGITKGDGADSLVMSTADLSTTKHTPHLPYELVVNGKKVIALRGRFRIAQSFPDLTMGTFMKIRSAPGAIKKTLTDVATL